MNTFSRSSRVKLHSAVCRYRPWDTSCFVGCGRPSQRTPQPLGFLIRCGRLSNDAGMVGWNCDQRSGKLLRTLGKRRPGGAVSCHLPPRSMVSLPAPRKRRTRKNSVSKNFDPPTGIDHRAMVQVESSDRLRVSPNPKSSLGHSPFWMDHPPI